MRSCPRAGHRALRAAELSVAHGPIDTYYRPDPAEIAQLFPGYIVLALETRAVSGTAVGDMGQLAVAGCPPR